MKIKPFNEFNEINEESLPKGILDDKDNQKALDSWFNQESKIQYTISTNDPITITTTSDLDLAKLKLLFYKYDIKFEVSEKKL